MLIRDRHPEERTRTAKCVGIGARASSARGTYTAIVRGANSATGVALAEVYTLN